MTTTPFHEGELAVQARAGVREQARRVGGIIDATLPSAARAFLARQPFAVLGSVGATGRVWASLLTGVPGFLHALDAQTVRIDADPVAGDPLGDNLHGNAQVGLLAIELATRRRMRINGRANSLVEGGLLLRTEEVFSNCPKYIQAREWAAPAPTRHAPGEPQRGTQLTPAQQQWVAAADTCFVASAHPARGVDASHRGGKPGFIRVVDDRTLVWPDYAGNNMFQTLGNLAVNPHVGLLFLDFERGATLQLTGTARVEWDEAQAATVPGAERLVEFHLDEVIEITNASPLRWRFRGFSPFNPD